MRLDIINWDRLFSCLFLLNQLLTICLENETAKSYFDLINVLRYANISDLTQFKSCNNIKHWELTIRLDIHVKLCLISPRGQSWEKCFGKSCIVPVSFNVCAVTDMHQGYRNHLVYE